jgi:hypothetical protein
MAEGILERAIMMGVFQIQGYFVLVLFRGLGGEVKNV